MNSERNNRFDPAEEEAHLNLLRTSDQLENRFGRLFREHGITASQYNVLRILRGEGKPMPCLEIRERMVHVVPAITGVIDRLEKQGWVSRERCTDDRRVIYVQITKPALALLKKLDKPIEELRSSFLGHLNKTELKELSRLLVKARQKL